jgi:hypothetical protein
MPAWTWIAASTRGTSHLKTGTRRQDAYKCYSPKEAPRFLLSVVSDGAGSAELGGEGASLVCRVFSSAAQHHLAETDSLPEDESVYAWIDQVRDCITFAATKRGKIPRDFAATLIAVLTDGTETLIAQVGDGCAVLRDAVSEEWEVPLWPAHGEYASTTAFVTDDPIAQCRIHRRENAIAGLAMMTDGLERLALDFQSKKPFPGFLDAMSNPVIAASNPGKDSRLSARLKEYLEGDAICSRTDDDKTLVVAARK